MSSSLPYLLHSKHRSLELCSLLLGHRFVIFVTAENWCLLVLKSLEHESINQCTGAKCHFLSPRIDTKDASMKPLACASAWHEGSPLGSLVFKLFKGPYALCWGVEPASRRNFPSDGLAYLFHVFWAARTARPILKVTTSCIMLWHLHQIQFLARSGDNETHFFLIHRRIPASLACCRIPPPRPSWQMHH